MMKKYKPLTIKKEQIDYYQPDTKVLDTISSLRDKNFSNADSRKELVNHIMSLYNSNDKVAKIALRRIGDLFTEIGDELIQLSKDYTMRNSGR